jgi:ATP-dependent helicase/nuclease subunit A
MTAEANITPQSTQEQIGEAATRLQDMAANPSYNVWVGASAGTGKTKVLTDRMLRLLLPTEGVNDGTPPEKILCITFTKAGANEMIARVMKTLSHWSVCTETALNESLTQLLGTSPSIKQRDKARRLFAMVVDLPEGLKITTIHGFCKSVLGRFPLEAGLPTHFNVIEESDAFALIRQARNALIQDIQNGKAGEDVTQAFAKLAQWKNGDQINQLINAILSDREKIKNYDRESIAPFLGLKSGDNKDDLKDQFFGSDFPENNIQTLIQALQNGAGQNQKKAAFLTHFLTLSPQDRIKNYKDYVSAFLKDDGDYYADSHISNGAKNYNPASPQLFADEAYRVRNFHQKCLAIDILESTQTLLCLAETIIDRYNTLKRHHNALDYDDLIQCTCNLLNGHTPHTLAMKDWVLYKLDGGINHILVDEAQDTNPSQWDIILKLSEDFFSGLGTRDETETERTLFVVGDEKQSIYRFQGAEPAIFDQVRNDIENRVTQADKIFKNVPMQTSFRSVSAILDYVDSVFNANGLTHSISRQNTPLHHTAFRQGQAGRVDIWPVYKTPATPPREPWQMPVEIRPSYDAKAALSEKIADQIKSWIDNNQTLQAHGRPIQPGDIMILVRRRNAFVDHMIRALKSRKIPVSGVDRMIVSDQIAVQDILAALSFALMPDDDLSLACLLKSPFIGWDDAMIEDYAYPREHSLWDAIRQSKEQQAVVAWLSGLIETAGVLSPFHAVNNLLISKTPHHHSGWNALISRLGDECIDPIDALLSEAQAYDMNDTASGVHGFVKKIKGSKNSLKREMESTTNQVRIMTIHASKGLQAPIVILPDTCTLPSAPAQSDKGFVWPRPHTPLWIKNSDDMNDTYRHVRDDLKQQDLDEYYRLLYVAMTRAEDRLLVCGYLSQKTQEPPEGSWYDIIQKSLSALPFKENIWKDDLDYTGDAAQSFVYETEQIADSREQPDQSTQHDEKYDLPSWIYDEFEPEIASSKTLRPSQMDDADVPVRSPLSSTDDSYRYRRGLLTHDLLQYLPDIAIDNRQTAARHYINQQAPDLPPETQESIIDESLAVLNKPEFAPFFATGSLAEVPVTGIVENPNTGRKDIISGQIDRMLVTDDIVWIVDYKSNRPPPKDPKNIPTAYRNQLRVYRMLMRDIYPDHDVRTALLWTDGPFMMEIDE